MKHFLDREISICLIVFFLLSLMRENEGKNRVFPREGKCIYYKYIIFVPYGGTKNSIYNNSRGRARKERRYASEQSI